MNTESQPQLNTILTTTNIPLLPATTLTRPAPVIEETAEPAAPVTPKMGDTITFTSSRGAIKQGIVTAIGILSVTKVKQYHVNVNGLLYVTTLDNILPAKMTAAPVEAPVMDADTAPVSQTKDELYQAMKEAEEIYIQYMRMDTFDLPADHATYKRKVAAHIAYLHASAAFTGLSNDHLIVYLYGKAALTKTAPQSSEKGDSSPSECHEQHDTHQWPEMPFSPVLEASEPFAPLPTVNTHPLALSQPGARWHGTDWDVVAAKRQAQYEAAQARIEAANGKYQAPVRKEIAMQDSAYLSSIFKAAN